MKNSFGRVSRNASEEIRVWLQEAEGDPCVELRVYNRSGQQGGVSLPEPEGLVVPVDALWDLIQVLEQTYDYLLKEGLVDIPSMRNLISADDPIKLHLVVDPPTQTQADSLGSPANKRREPRVPVKLSVECYLMGAPDTWPSEKVTGELRDLSSGGAQVWLPEQFPVGSRLAVMISIGELIFRGQARVVGVAPHPQDGNYRHNLQWVPMDPQVKATLSKIIDTAK